MHHKLEPLFSLYPCDETKDVDHKSNRKHHGRTNKRCYHTRSPYQED